MSIKTVVDQAEEAGLTDEQIWSLLDAFMLSFSPVPWPGVDEDADVPDDEFMLTDELVDATLRLGEEARQAAPLMQALLARVRVLQQNPLPQPAAFQKEKRAIIAAWNTATKTHGWLVLSRFCVNCGKPIGLRTYWDKTAKSWEGSDYCSKVCQNNGKSLAHYHRVGHYRRRLRQADIDPDDTPD